MSSSPTCSPYIPHLLSTASLCSLTSERLISFDVNFKELPAHTLLNALLSSWSHFFGASLSATGLFVHKVALALVAPLIFSSRKECANRSRVAPVRGAFYLPNTYGMCDQVARRTFWSPFEVYRTVIIGASYAKPSLKRRATALRTVSL